MKSFLIGKKFGYNLSTVFPGLLTVIKHETVKSTSSHPSPQINPKKLQQTQPFFQKISTNQNKTKQQNK